MNALNDRTLDVKSKLVASFLVNFCAYFDGEMHSFSNAGSKLVFTKYKKSKRKKVLIVSSSFYTEDKQEYPIDDKKEVLKLVKLQEQENQHILLQNIGENKSTVNLWRYSGSVPRSWFRIPETLLFARGGDDGEVLTVLNERQNITYVTSFNHVVHSAAHKGLINSVANFALSAGISVDKQTTITFDDKANYFAFAMSKLTMDAIRSFWLRPSRSKVASFFAKLILPGVFTYFIYLMLSSAYLSGRIYIQEAELAKQDTQVTELLQLQEDVEFKQRQQMELSQFWSEKGSIAALWVVLTPVFETSDIRSIVLQNGKYIIRGRTEDASALLDKLATDPNVLTARFEAPVRNQRNKDSYQISIELNNGKLKLRHKDKIKAKGEIDG